MIKIVITARPNLFGYVRTREEEVRECEDLVTQIKRHVDGLGSVEIIDDEEESK